MSIYAYMNVLRGWILEVRWCGCVRVIRLATGCSSGNWLMASRTLTLGRRVQNLRTGPADTRKYTTLFHKHYLICLTQQNHINCLMLNTVSLFLMCCCVNLMNLEAG